MLKLLGIFFAVLGISLLTPRFCANSESCIDNLSGEYEDNAYLANFMNQNLPVPNYIAREDLDPNVLSVVSSESKRIEVDLTNQMLYAYENNQEVMSFPISSGKWGKTPTGTFTIWIKLRYTRMSGGVKGTGTYYNLPNVPYTMYFYNESYPKIRGFGLHGAYWHNNFGHPMSHGCVNISPENAGRLYAWADPQTVKNVTYATEENPGTQIVIYGVAPRE